MGKCKIWTLDWTGLMDWTHGLDSWTGLWTEIWTDTQFNDDHFQQSVALKDLGYALATAYPRQVYATLNKQSVPHHCLFLYLY